RDGVEASLGRKAKQVSADAGYCSEENLAGLEARTIDAYVATGRAKDAVAGTEKGEAAPAPSAAQPDETPTRVEAMRAKIKAGGHHSPYRLRKQLPEPVFSANSCCAASKRCAPSGLLSAPPTIFSEDRDRLRGSDRSARE